MFNYTNIWIILYNLNAKQDIGVTELVYRFVHDDDFTVFQIGLFLLTFFKDHFIKRRLLVTDLEWSLNTRLTLNLQNLCMCQNTCNGCIAVYDTYILYEL